MSKTKQTLPTDIKAKDLEYPRPPASYSWGTKKYKEWEKKPANRLVQGSNSFELWCVERRDGNINWAIPTLQISNSRAGGRRTYAVEMDGGTVRIGQGPHVLERHTVYVREGRLKELQKFLDLKLNGEKEAHRIRDQRSSRRLNNRNSRWY